MASRTFVAFDTETTGLWAAANRIVELAGVRFHLDDDHTETYQTLINPERPIPAEVVEIHGINDEMVAEAPLAKEALAAFADFCGGDSILIAHNAPFDISFVGHELQRASMTFGENLILDTVDIFRRYYAGEDSYSLMNLARAHSIADSQNHRALADAILVQRLFLKASEHLGAIEDEAALAEAVTVYRMSHWKEEVGQLPDQYIRIGQAIEQNRKLEICYSSGGKPPQWRTIKPLLVHRQGWKLYLNAYCETAGAERTFRLDRIESHRLIEQE